MGRLGEEAAGRPSEYLLDAEGNAAGAAAYATGQVDKEGWVSSTGIPASASWFFSRRAATE